MRPASIPLLILLFFLVACRGRDGSAPSTSFYFWKTQYRLRQSEKEILKKYKVTKIYLRCFDVSLVNGTAQPRGVLLWNENALPGIHYIPVVFISNEVFRSLPADSLPLFAGQVLKLSRQIMNAQELELKELQVDCDWTASTREAYFRFLQLLAKEGIHTQSTLRLYQYKYRNESGIPPVGSVSLMCYNMGSPDQESSVNSILDRNTLLSYIKDQPPYPLPLNIALPLFEWNLLYGEHGLQGILYTSPELQNGLWEELRPGFYVCKQDYYDLTCERKFFAGQKLREEHLDARQIRDAKSLVAHFIKNTKNEILYFDLDSAKLRHLPQ